MWYCLSEYEDDEYEGSPQISIFSSASKAFSLNSLAIVEPAVDVHHIDSFMNYTGNMRLQKAYDFHNLQSLCKECHSNLHKN